MNVNKSHLGIEISKFSLGNNVILESFNEIVYENEKVGIIGPNGVGKSTLLDLISNRKKIRGGIIHNTFPEEVMYITEDNCFFEQLTFEENLDYFQTVFDTSDEIRKRIENQFQKDISNAVFMKSASTGQRKRMMLAIGLMANSKLYLFDEPTNGLDMTSKQTLTNYIHKHLENSTTLIVSHDFSFIKEVCQRVMLILNRNTVIHIDLTKIATASDLERLYYEYTA